MDPSSIPSPPKLQIAHVLADLNILKQARDEEFMRAKTLLAYYNHRHKLQEKGQRGMKMSQERVNKALNEQAEKRHQNVWIFAFLYTSADMSIIFRRGLATASPFKSASKVVCIGRNYADHVTELNNAKPKQPFFFLKPPSSILPPNGGAVIRPKGVDLHYEVELALIMGKQVKNLEAENEKEAYDSIESYAMSIDMTARNAQNEAKKKGLPWDIAKGFDTFLPMSNIISKSQIPDPHNATVWLTVNNEHRQKDSTELMLFRIPRILSDISKVMTLEKGDVVLTGTPKGVGSVKPGDVMRVGISVGGKELEEGKIEVAVEESTSTYEFKET
ncbi:hydrolase C21C3.09c [Botrytis cinerea]